VGLERLNQRALIRPSGTFSHSLKRERTKGKLSGIIALARSEGMGEGGRRPGEGLSPRVEHHQMSLRFVSHHPRRVAKILKNHHNPPPPQLPSPIPHHLVETPSEMR
jgi:hypothetical protein